MITRAIPSRTPILLVIAAVAAVATGCGKTPSASFRPNLVASSRTVAPDSDVKEPWRDWADARQRQVATILEAMFGTPDEPHVLPETGLDPAKIRRAAGPVRSDIAGRKNGLYREHCAHCHGITGDGMGPTAAFLNPYPRDYRPGKFKFKSTWRDQKPTHADLVKILHDGIVGTSMPSFALLSPTQVDALAEYVKYLAIRGETELALYTHIEQELEGKDMLPETREFLVDEILVPVAEKWQAVAEPTAQIPVAPVPAGIDFALGGGHPANKESIEKGRKLFLGDGGCVKCHGPTALGDGQANDYDDWNKTVVEFSKGVAARQEKLSENRNVEFYRAGQALGLLLGVLIGLWAFDRFFVDRFWKYLSRIPILFGSRNVLRAYLVVIALVSLALQNLLTGNQGEPRNTSASIAGEAAWLGHAKEVLEGDALRPRTIPPRNLRLGLYRGGRRPLDIYRRLYTGINGAPMPGVGPAAPGGKGTVPDEDIWHIVNYVLSLPYELDGELGADRVMAAKDRF